MAEEKRIAVEIDGLSFTYPGLDGRPPPNARPLLSDVSFRLREGDRCLLVGANGAGKSTLLKIIAGHHMVMSPGDRRATSDGTRESSPSRTSRPQTSHPSSSSSSSAVRVLNDSPFHGTWLTSSGKLAYLGGEWRRDVAFAGYDVAIQMDVSARQMIFGVKNVDESRRERLVKILDVDLDWRLHRVSDGQRRRVQLCMGLLAPFQVLLLDEITVDLDVLVRSDLMKFLKSECDERNATIIYATHIFDNLDSWPTHVVYLSSGKLQFIKPLSEIQELQTYSLMQTIEIWLRRDIEADRKSRKTRNKLTMATKNPNPQVLNNGWGNGRLTPTVKVDEMFNLSSNRVLRM